jgi:hypothetical protein
MRCVKGNRPGGKNDVVFRFPFPDERLVQTQTQTNELCTLITRTRAPGRRLRWRFSSKIGPVLSALRKAGGGVKSLFVRPAPASAPALVPAASSDLSVKPTGHIQSFVKPRKKTAKQVTTLATKLNPIGLGGTTLGTGDSGIETNTSETNTGAAMSSSSASVETKPTKPEKPASDGTPEKTSSGAGGYHYFHEMANKGTAPRAQPKKITAAEAEALTNQLAGSGGSGLSSWNTAGTWEERNHTAWAESRVTEMVVGFVCPPTTSDKFTAKLVSIKSFKGDATVVMVRGKPRSGFDFDVTIAWEAVFLTGDVDGLTGDGEKGTCRISQSRHTICP